MPYVVADRVKETSTSTGTGNFTLAGAATGFRTFSSSIGVGNTTTYVIADATGSQWEVGLGTLSGASTLARTYVFSNSAGNTSRINFSAGTKSVFVSMAAAPLNSNVVLGTSSGFSPDLYTNNTVIGSTASSGGDGNTVVGVGATASGPDALAIGINSTANAFATVAVGRTSSASNTGATAVGPGANAGGFQSVAIGNDSNASNSGSASVGYGANSSGVSSVAIGYGANVNASSTEGIAVGAYSFSYIESGIVSPTSGIVVGSNSYSHGGITIGESSGENPGVGQRSIIIGHGIVPVESDATYMNKFRTGVTPVGTSWFLKWDDSTKEVYADPGAAPTGANWYTYQDGGAGFATLSIAMPTSTPSSFTSGTDNWLQWTNSFTPTSNWSSSSSYSFFSTYYTYYGVSYPLPDPTAASSTLFGFAVSYYAGYPSDSGTTSTLQAYTGAFGYQASGGSITVGSYPFFGSPSSQVGHAIIMISGNYTSSVSPNTGVTVVETAYDSYNNVTYVFVDIDASTVSFLSGGSGVILTIGGFTNYNVIFWYNYA